MVAVIIHWENANWLYKQEENVRKVLNCYAHTLKAFGYNKLVLVDVDKTEPLITDPEINSTVCASLEEAISQLSGFSFVYVENLPKAQNFNNFIHPIGNTCYIIGSDYGQLAPNENDTVVRIPTKIPLWSYIAMAIVLNDRRQKEDRVETQEVNQFEETEETKEAKT